MTDFLLELRSEEIPARMQVKAKDDLARLFAEEIAKAGLIADSIETFATPRRLALIARGLPDQTKSVSEERKGPRVSAPEQALSGFLRSTGLTREQLTERDGIFYATLDKPGRPTADVLAEAIPAIIRAFPWPKSMRWGDASLSTESLRWVRPLQGIVALFGEEIVECEIDGIVSGAATMGHRFHHGGSLVDPTNQKRGPITIGSADDYVEKLRLCHVIVHLSERCKLIEDGAAKAAAAAGLTVIPDEGLVLENAGLTEWPVPLLGRFDPAFLDVPREVIQLTMRTNQKYFACTDADGKLANAFVCTANIDASDGGAAVIAGNEKVLSARLSDAKFFWEADLKTPLDEQAKKLSQIVFHEKLGTVDEKVERVAKLARWLVEEGIVKSSPERGGGPRNAVEGPLRTSDASSDDAPPSAPPPPPLAGEDLATLAEQAAKLCKADLVTGMVGEFPELQGIMGGYYARAQGYPDAVADAIRDHYKPVGQGDDVPTVPVTVAVSLADKLVTLFAFFAIEEKPTGSKDPFALRRAGIAVLALIQENNLRIDLRFVFTEIGAAFIQRIDRSYLDGLRDTLSSASLSTRSSDNLADVKVAAAREVWKAHEPFSDEQIQRSRRLAAEVVLFLVERLKQQQKDNGIRPDLIAAGFESLGIENDVVSLLARVKALQGFVGTDEGKNLLAGYKRAANILKKEGVSQHRQPALDAGLGSSWANGDKGSQTPDQGRGEDLSGKLSLSYTPHPEEQSLIDALDSAEPLATAAIEREDFEGAMSALASLRAPIDAFFETVTVNDPDPDKREARLALLARVRDAVHRVADFSKIEG